MKEHALNASFVSVCRESWFAAGEGLLLLAVSGGADSTALLLACAMAGIPFETVHCNFNLRGTESLRDRDFVRTLAEKYGVRLHVVEFDANSERMRGESIEMTCRRLRYDVFRSLLSDIGASRIVLAHNADDNAETFFINALRGSGARGLKGMVEDTGELLRPLLKFSRAQILQFLKENNQDFVTDSSNLTTDYRRNILRNEIFPSLEKEWKGFRKAITSTIELSRRDSKIVEFFIAKALEGSDRYLSRGVIRDFPEPVTLIYRFIEPYGGTPSIAEEMASSSLKPVSGKRWKFSNDFFAILSREGICIETSATEADTEIKCEWLPIEGAAINWDEIKASPLTTAWLPRSENHYEWRKADRKMKIKSLGINGTQSVWKLLKDAGIPAVKRDRYPVLTDKETGDVIWIPGIRRARLQLVTKNDTRIYKVNLSI